MIPLLPEAPPRRILVLGPSGSGKSTVCTKIGRILGIPSIHLDMHYWKPDWTETPKEEWQGKVSSLTAGTSWVMDGNYTSTLKMRTDAADTLIFLDMTRRQSYYRVISRYLKHRGSTRPDLGEDCPEKIDLDFLRWIWDYPRTRKPRILEFLNSLRGTKNVYILRNQGEIDQFLETLVHRFGGEN